MSEETKIKRRSFIDWLLQGGLLVWLGGVIAPVLVYIWPAQRRGPTAQTTSVGKVDDFPVWSAKIVAVASHPVVVFRMPQGFRAFSAICTHLGCVVYWNATQHEIDCPCHAGRFDLNGRVISGPPPRPLPKETVRVINGEVIVQLS